MECAQQETPAVSATETVKLPKNTKGIKYYYRHREEILEKRMQKKMEDPEYQAKQVAKEEAKKAKEEEVKKAKEEKRILKLKEKEEQRKLKEEIKEKEKEERCRERAKKKAELLGVKPLVSSGLN